MAIPALVTDIGTGPVVIAYLLDDLFYGVLIVQVYLYYSAFPNDKKSIKTLVWFLFSICTFQSILHMRDMFTYFGVNYGNVEEFQKLRLGGYSLPTTTGIVSCAVQIFYAYQIHVISRSKLIAGSVTLLAILQMTAAFLETAAGARIRLYPHLRNGAIIECTIWLTGSALCDIIIAVVMTFYLIRAESVLKRRYSPLRRLLCLIVETGTASATFATVGCVLFLLGVSTYHQIAVKSLGKIYVSSLLVILNSRMRVVGGRYESRHEDANIMLSYISRSTTTVGGAMSGVVGGGGRGGGRAGGRGTFAIQFAGPRQLVSGLGDQGSTTTTMTMDDCECGHGDVGMMVHGERRTRWTTDPSPIREMPPLYYCETV
ncbi:hypothetical protein K435DRAFT_778069 [Dendrothele bispora CBS 962.96]|uniref:DUF6534 domain-containing protein n=1 Tax=Dendrothele bispora (strain CBS 962.96) TaxID=1314807 RepID=A0A4S8M599_DENBC|nr:hypothetical protein K435DRAFT_778069 [Dendrothele bispora CBS 962.96]